MTLVVTLLGPRNRPCERGFRFEAPQPPVDSDRLCPKSPPEAVCPYTLGRPQRVTVRVAPLSLEERSVSSFFAAEGGWQEFTLRGGEWAVLWLSAAAAVLALGVGFFLVRKVMAEPEGSPKMREIAKAIQERALAY